MSPKWTKPPFGGLNQFKSIQMKSFITYKVVNADLFNSVDDVEFDLTSKGGTYKFKYRDAYFQGDVSIEVNGQWKTISGQHGANDYADDYGFEIVTE